MGLNFITYNDLQKLLPKAILDEFGILNWGVSNDPNVHSLDQYNKWVEKGLHKPLLYLEGQRQKKRQRLTEFYPQFQSALMFAFDYEPRPRKEENGLKMASYVLGFDGIDYHLVLSQRLENLAQRLKQNYASLQYEIIVDTKPVLERDLAYKAGLGWFGKNSMLIAKEGGSYFLIGGLLLNFAIQDAPVFLESDHCGHCRACVTACPTSAIDEVERSVRAQDCISTYTIELFKESGPPLGYDQTAEFFGCDICQEVCPWNNKVISLALKNPQEKLAIRGPEYHSIVNFFFKVSLKELLSRLNSTSQRAFKKKFLKTSLARTGKLGLLKNLNKKQRL